ncbi:Molybdopterin-guanine dinucleotide biosynthesis protein MobA [hydrothermal vent metagenome]|uniref:Molybdopterin-guanine dinucleotide biosynthesis protein MobA n=1 Tax=hydrothermal vent metagenome TaxID=652676 RepID=A0A1W1D3T9_9ZZZZ
MGEDKALLPFPPYDTLIEFQFRKLSKIFQNVFISSKTPFHFQAPIIYDIEDTFAPTIGFISIFQTLQCEKFFAISVDTPFIDKTIISTLIQNDHPTNDATIAKTSHKTHPLCGIYHKSLQNHFINMVQQNNHKLGYLLQNVKTKYIFFQDEKLFLNLNNKHQYHQALTQILL